jgi:nucleoid-associated protein YgaU
LKAKDALERRLAEREAAKARKKAEQSKVAQAPLGEPKKPTDPKASEPQNAQEPKSAEAGKEPTSRAARRRERARIAANAGSGRGYKAKVAPATCEAPGTKVDLPGWYVVKEGDTLWGIAEQHYGAGWRYKRIYAANRRRVHNAHWISPCQRLYLPRGPRRA